MIVKRFYLIILRFLKFWKVFKMSGISRPKIIKSCRSSESAINSALLVIAKTESFKPVSE